MEWGGKELELRIWSRGEMEIFRGCLWVIFWEVWWVFFSKWVFGFGLGRVFCSFGCRRYRGKGFGEWFRYC